MKQVTALYVKIKFRPVDQGLFQKLNTGYQKMVAFLLVDKKIKCKLRM